MPSIEQLKHLIETSFNQNVRKTFPIRYQVFKQVESHITQVTGSTHAKIIAYDKKATIFFDKCPKLVFIVTNNRFLFAKHFDFMSARPDFKSASKKPITIWTFLWDEIRHHHVVSVFGTLFFGPLFFFQDSDAFIQNVNTAVIMTATIVVTVFLIFISFFYSTKNGDQSYFLGGTYYRHSKDDRHISTLAFASVGMAIMAMGIQFYTTDPNSLLGVPEKTWKFIFLLQHWIVTTPTWIGNGIAGAFTWLAILSLYLCILAITGYYFDRIQNDFYKQVMQKVISRSVSAFENKNSNELDQESTKSDPTL